MILRLSLKVANNCYGSDFHMYFCVQIIVVGERKSSDTVALMEVVNSNYLPNKVLIFHEPGSKSFLTEHLPALKNMAAMDNKATAYVCENFTCKTPVTEPKELRKLLRS